MRMWVFLCETASTIAERPVLSIVHDKKSIYS